MGENIVNVHGYDWSALDVNDDDEDYMSIRCWALDRESNPVLLRINGFPAFFHVELPMFVRGRPFKWDKKEASMFMERVGARCSGIVSWAFYNTQKTYYYRMDKKFPMIRILFSTLYSMHSCADLLSEQIKTERWSFVTCKVWEKNISPVRKLLTAKDIKYSQWFSCAAEPVDEDNRISSCIREYIVDWTTMRGLSSIETKGWITKPRVLAFDIETYSDNHRGFPDKFNSAHVAYMISCIYQRCMEPSSRKRFGIVMGKCDQIPPERLQNCEIISVTTEYELCEAFAKVVVDTDPEIITGYNILSFDYPYLDHRIMRWLKKWPQMGRINDKLPVMSTKTWQSSAYGHQSINILQMDGRISIDLLPIMKRDYTFDKYDLATISTAFLGKTKHDISAREMFEIYEASTKSSTPEEISRSTSDMTRVMEYCIQDSELVIDLMEKINLWLGIVELSSIVGVSISELYTSGQQKRCLSAVYDTCAKKGHVLDTRDTPGWKFTGALVQEPVPGVHDNVIALDFASLYPSIIRAYNICYTTLVPPELDSLVPDEDCNVIEFDQVEEDDNDDEDDLDTRDIRESSDDRDIQTKSNDKNVVKTHYRYKFYKNKVGILPVLVTALTLERKAVNAEIARIGKDMAAMNEMENMLSSVANSVDVNSGSKIRRNFDLVRDIQSSSTHDGNKCMELVSIMSMSDEDAIKTLNETRKERLEWIVSNRVISVVLNERQKGLKVTNNSFFGFLGVTKGGKLPLIEGAMSITAKGRELITITQNYIQSNYNGKLIAGDTDSVMFTMPQLTEAVDCDYWGTRIAQEINGILPGNKDIDGKLHPEGRPGLFPPPLSIEFEKAMRMFCIKKKKYAAYIISKDGSFKTEKVMDKSGAVVGQKKYLLKKGIVLARRDNCKLLRNLYTEILMLIMDGASILDALTCLSDSVNKLYRGEIHHDDLVIIRSLGNNYKSGNFFMKIFSDNLRRAGKVVNPGDRLDFVIIKNDSLLLGDKMMLREQYIDPDNTEKIDEDYYMEKAIQNPINQLFSVGYSCDMDKFKSVYYLKSKRCKPVYLDRPVTLMLNMVKKGIDISVLVDSVKRILDKPQKKVVIRFLPTLSMPNVARETA